MNIEESKNQIETLIEAWQLDEADLNQTDINAMQVLLKENQELKKQVKETDRKLFFTKNELDMREKTIDNKLNQQKEFIKYLDDETRSCKAVSELLFNSNKEMKVYKEILQKYKEIIGDDK